MGRVVANNFSFPVSRFQVNCGCIPPLCELLTVQDAKIIQVALNGLDNILKAGEQQNIRPNPYAVLIEECYGEWREIERKKSATVINCVN